MSYLSLNRAAIDNLLGGKMPPYAALSRTRDGVRIRPAKTRRGDALTVSNGMIPLPDEVSEELTSKRFLAARMEDSGSIIVYPVSQPVKTFQPSAVVRRTAPKPQSIKLADVEAEELKTFHQIIPPAIRTPSAEKTEPVRETMLIKREEVIPVAEAAATPTTNEVPDDLDRLEEQMMKWAKAPTTSSPPVASNNDTLHFAGMEEPRTLGMKRESARTIHVAPTFDKRRNLAARAIEVVVRRRRIL